MRAQRGFYRKRGRIGRFKDAALTLCFLFLLVLIAARLQGGASDPVVGPFRVVDGDTLAAGAERLRLADIDAPELDQTCEHDGQEWACGQEAKAILQRLMQRGSAECHGSERDRYGRLIVNCFVDGRTVGGEMVRSGMAVTTSLVTYRREQADAQTDAKGIWAGPFTLPAEWRRERRLEQEGGDFLSGMKDLLSLEWL
ncbi:thermonuclease family protein [Rhizobiales bacterium RZME27]|uniref:Thermonuclease family protein n=1 Tax=Endobacterium cereale TaxID=2663029 RepID=A0A6A8AHZ4_9HYPH|nr:thermonuclease family protein [Endobacterium cereale]MEB2843859.1 thermonuclease family protein [Endobacterium cereale]MQY49468.1 thermonuclease family protein [Endobacterium cereale]